jgi:sporulation protein YlmC with PRC-barrel domain
MEPANATHRTGARIVGGTLNLSGPGPQVMGASSLRGDLVLNHGNEKLGELADIMIDVETGAVAYAVLAFGGVLGLGEKLFAIPWHALTLDADRRCFLLDVERSQLESAPGFDKDHWPSMADPAWVEEAPALPRHRS